MSHVSRNVTTRSYHDVQAATGAAAEPSLLSDSLLHMHGTSHTLLRPVLKSTAQHGKGSGNVLTQTH